MTVCSVAVLALAVGAVPEWEMDLEVDDPVARQIVLAVDPNLPLASCRGTVPLSASEVLNVDWLKTSAGLVVHDEAPKGWTVRKSDGR